MSSGMEYCGGVKNVKIGVAEMVENSPSIHTSRIPDISIIQNVVYDGNKMILRKASGVGPGRVINFSSINVPINMHLVESFEP